MDRSQYAVIVFMYYHISNHMATSLRGAAVVIFTSNWPKRRVSMGCTHSMFINALMRTAYLSAERYVISSPQ